MNQAGPTMSRRRMGAHLRRLREARGITGEAASEVIRSSASKISRMEAGQVPFKARDVADLLTLYGVTKRSEREVILAQVIEANEPGWWDRFNDVLPGWARPYVGLEAEAKLIRIYAAQAIPSLLQTPEYAHATLSISHPTGRTISRLIELRMRRQERLRAPGAPHLWVVLDEAALRHPYGAGEVLSAQIGHLIEVAKFPNVTLQVMRLRARGRTPAIGSTTILRFDDADLPDVVYLEHLTGANYLDRRQDAEIYLQAMDKLVVGSEPPNATVEILCRARGY